MGGYDIAASFSAAADANSAADFRQVGSVDNSRGSKLPPWLPLAVIAGVVVVALVWLVRKF